MRGQPGRSPEEGATLSAADDHRRTFTTGRCCGRCRWSGSLFAASAGSSTLSPLPPPSPSSDGTRASESGAALAPAGIQLSAGLVALGPGYLRLNLLAGGGPNPKGHRDEEEARLPVASPSFPGGIARNRGRPNGSPSRTRPSCRVHEPECLWT